MQKYKGSLFKQLLFMFFVTALSMKQQHWSQHPFTPMTIMIIVQLSTMFLCSSTFMAKTVSVPNAGGYTGSVHFILPGLLTHSSHPFPSLGQKL